MRCTRRLLRAALVVVSVAFAMVAIAPSAGAVAASAEGWTLKSPATSPSARYGQPSAYDPATGQLIMFGGRLAGGGDVAETWNWTGSTWAQLSPATSPSARTLAAMAFDPAIGKIVLFGGSAGGYSNETWTWNGATWTKLAISGPSARYGAVMTYDPTTGALILFGGVTAAGVSNETWSFDGANWTQLSAASTGTPPAARYSAALTFDAATGSAVLFGGNNGSSLSDTWTFGNGRWTQRSPSSSPPPAYWTWSAFDPNSGQLVLFEVGTSSTWTWDGSTWTTAAGGPSYRSYASPTYDPRSSQLVMFGGLSNGTVVLGETWTYGLSVASTTWTAQAPSSSPGSRSDGAMAYDPATGQMILFGGYGASSYTDTWSWNGSTWVNLAPSTTPQTSLDANLAFDDATGQLILFGGTNASGTVVNLTYAWTGTNWVQLTPSTSPAARWGSFMKFDPISGRLILFGGADGGNNALNDTWAWDGTTWSQLSPATTPAARIQSGQTFDPNTGRLLMFGGQGTNSGTSTPMYNDTWTWSGSNWIKLTPATSPPVRGGIQYQLDYDPALARTVLFGGINFSAGTNYADTWTWTGSNWVQISPPATPTAVNAAQGAFDPRDGEFTMFGGDALGAGTQNTTSYLDVVTNAFPQLKTASSMSFASTLNGYDQHIVAAQSVSVPVPSGANWNVSISGGQPTSGGNTLPSLTVNGSASNYAASTAPAITCTGSGCTTPTTFGSVTYPTTTPVAGNAVIYGAQANSGSGTANIALDFWATVPAAAAPGTYASAMTVSTNFGP